MNATLATPLLIPTSNPTPVEKAAVDGIAGDAEPEAFLWIVFHRPDGGARVWYAWTAGGPDLGDHADRLALGAGLDAADWLHIIGQHRQDSARGRIEIQTYLLRPIIAAISAGDRAPEMSRGQLARIVGLYAEKTGQPQQGPIEVPHWCGVGPKLLTP